MEEKKSTLDKINEYQKIINPEEYNEEKRTFSISQKKKKILKRYIEQCRNVLHKDIEVKVKELQGEELIEFIKLQSKKNRWGTLASVEDDYKKLCKREQKSMWFGLEFLVGLMYFENTYNIQILKKEDFK